MRMRLELCPGDLPAKGRVLLSSLADSLRDYPEVVEALVKAAVAVDDGQVRLRQPAARDMAQKLHDAYQRQLAAMVQDIGRVLDRAAQDTVVKSLAAQELEPAEFGPDWVELPEDVALLLMEGLDKARVPKYLRRVMNPTPPPKYKYFYNLTGGQGLGHADEMQQGSSFAFEHQGQAGHYQVQKVEGDRVQVKHTATGHELNTTKDELRQHLREHHADKIRGAIAQAAKHRAQRLREMYPEHAGAQQEAKPEPAKAPEAKPAAAPAEKPAAPAAPPVEKPAVPEPSKPAAAPAPRLERVTMAHLGGTGGYDRIEAVGVDAGSLEAQAAALGGDREYAVIDQGQSLALVSRAKGKPGRETVGGRTTVFLKNETGSGLQDLAADWVVMEAADLIASHHPESFSPRQDYPEGVQERRYHDVKDEQMKVDRVARKMTPEFVANTNPDAVNGAPIVTEDGVVLGGNGRTMGMQRAYALYPDSADKLKAYLAAQAQSFGLSPGAVQGMKQPILVRRIQAGKDKAQLTRLGRRMNESLTQGLDPRAEEVAVSKFVTGDVVASLTAHMDPDQTMSEFLHKGQSLPFVKDLERAGIIDAQNRAQYVDADTGLLNEGGRSRVLRVFAARMIPDAKLLETMDQSLRNNLAAAVPFLMTAEENGWDLREALHTAVVADQEMSAKDYPRDAKGRSSFRRQMSLLGDKDTVRDKVQTGPAAVMLDIIQDHNGPQKLQRGFRAFAAEAAAQAHDFGAQSSMFARPKVSMDQALAQAFKLKGEGMQGSLLAASYAGRVDDLVKADGAGAQEKRDAFFALTMEARRQVAAQVQSAMRGHGEFEPKRVVDKLEVLVEDLVEQYPGAAGKLRKVDLRAMAQAMAQAQGLPKGDLQKAGPYIGPRGGKWADPQHTIPWKEAAPGTPHPGWTSAQDAVAWGAKNGHQYVRIVAHPVDVGDTLAPSYRWDDGDQTDEQLSGTSALDTSHRFSAMGGSALYEGRVVAVEGTKVGEGEDPGEVLLQGAKVVAISSSRGLTKAQGGPYIGPRGGKWADPQHTIPWKPEHPGQLDLFQKEAVEHGVNLPSYFASGSNHRGEIQGFADLGINVGVAAPDLDKRGNAENALHSLAGKPIKVFVDSGAFGEMSVGPSGLQVKKPITDAEWAERLALYDRLATSLGAQLYAVAPDRVGDQEVTLARLRRWAPEVRAIREKGAHILVPLQKGAMPLREFDRQVAEILGEPYVRAIPMKKDATSLEDLQELVSGGRIQDLHLLGVGPESKKYPAIMDMLRRVSPNTRVTLDSVKITAAVGRPETGPPRKLTAAMDKVRERMAEETTPYMAADDAGTDMDYTDYITQPSAWATRAQLGEMADQLDLSSSERAQLLADPDEWVSERGMDPLVEGQLDRMWGEWAEKTGRTAARKREAVRLAFGEIQKALDGGGGGGPFIGPRGGKWADAAHTIPWEEPGSGRATVPEHLQDIQKEHHALPEKEQHRRYFTDRNTGLLNARGADTQPHDPARPMTARFSMEGFKAFNDRFGHEIPDGALRHMANVLGRHMQDGVKRGGDLEGDVRDQAHADKIAAEMAKEIDPQGRIKVVATAVPRKDDHNATLEALGTAHRARKDAEVEAGRMGHRLKDPIAFEGHPEPAKAMQPLAMRMHAATAGENARLSQHHAAEFRKVGSHGAFRTAHLEDTGLLTDDGFARSHEKHPDHHVASADMRGLQAINDAFGREAADTILRTFSELMVEKGGQEFAAAHPHGDEYLAHHADPEKLRGFFSDLSEASNYVAFYLEKNGGVVFQKGLHFVSGIGRTLDEADRIDLAKNKAAQGDVPKPRVLSPEDADREIARLRDEGVRLVDLGGGPGGGVRRGQGEAGGQGQVAPAPRPAASPSPSPTPEGAAFTRAPNTTDNLSENGNLAGGAR